MKYLFLGLDLEETHPHLNLNLIPRTVVEFLALVVDLQICCICTWENDRLQVQTHYERTQKKTKRCIFLGMNNRDLGVTMYSLTIETDSLNQYENLETISRIQCTQLNLPSPCMIRKILQFWQRFTEHFHVLVCTNTHIYTHTRAHTEEGEREMNHGDF